MKKMINSLVAEEPRQLQKMDIMAGECSQFVSRGEARRSKLTG